MSWTDASQGVAANERHALISRRLWGSLCWGKALEPASRRAKARERFCGRDLPALDRQDAAHLGDLIPSSDLPVQISRRRLDFFDGSWRRRQCQSARQPLAIGAWGQRWTELNDAGPISGNVDGQRPTDRYIAERKSRVRIRPQESLSRLHIAKRQRLHEVRSLAIANDDHQLAVLFAVCSGNIQLLSECPEREKALSFLSFESGTDERFRRLDVTKDLAEGVASLSVTNKNGNQLPPLR
jgi:hypothetical protein